MENKKILIVEDNAGLRGLLTYLVKNWGGSPVPFSTATEALEYLKDDTADIIMTDLMMPEMDGYEFLRRVEALKYIPSVILTATPSHVVWERVEEMRLGPYAVLSKPSSSDDIREALNRGLGISMDLKSIRDNKKALRVMLSDMDGPLEPL
jgi:CheY-like chemotaxis protein